MGQRAGPAVGVEGVVQWNGVPPPAPDAEEQLKHATKMHGGLAEIALDECAEIHAIGPASQKGNVEVYLGDVGLHFLECCEPVGELGFEAHRRVDAFVGDKIEFGEHVWRLEKRRPFFVLRLDRIGHGMNDKDFLSLEALRPVSCEPEWLEFEDWYKCRLRQDRLYEIHRYVRIGPQDVNLSGILYDKIGETLHGFICRREETCVVVESRFN